MKAPGLRADSITGWMASLGLAAIAPGVRLRWDDAGVPTLSGADVAGIAEALPDLDWLAQCSIARHHPGAGGELVHNPSEDVVQERMRMWAETPDKGTLVAALHAPDGRRSPWAVGAPAGRTIWDRAVRCRLQVDDVGVERAIANALGGLNLGRVAGEGLGWDGLRHAPAPGLAPAVRPGAELLSFCGLMMAGPSWVQPGWEMAGEDPRVCARGWSRRGVLVWSLPVSTVDRWGLDAHLSGFHPERPSWATRHIPAPNSVSPPGGWMAVRLPALPEALARDLMDADGGVEVRHLGRQHGVAPKVIADWLHAAGRADLVNWTRPTGRPRSHPCGTPAGHRRHRRAGEEPCEPCRAAEAARQAQLHLARRGR